MNEEYIMKKYDFEYPRFEDLNPANCREVSMRIHYPGFYEYLKEHYQGKQITFAEMIYLFYHGLENPPVCRICGGKTKFIGYNKGYREFCSYRCMNSCPDIQERKKTTSMRNYGVEHSTQAAEVKAKAKETCMSRYGVENPFQLKTVKERSRQTCLEKYGTEYANQSEDVKKKIWEAKFNIALDKYDGIMDILNGDKCGSIYVMKCPDEKCTLCQEKTFEIRSDILRSRLQLHTDLCTTRYPVGVHIKNTSIERFVQDLLDEYDIKYETNNRSLLGGKELDIYIPSSKIAIECNGVYWHSMYDARYHYDKWKTCAGKGIQLLSIWEDWVTTKPEIVRSLVLAKLGIYQRSIGASRCHVRKVPPKDARAFLDDNHIQGFCNSTYKYGLYYKDELVAIMLFSKENNASSGSGPGWTLQRFCNLRNTHVVGGAARLLSHFMKDHPEGDIISFASHDVSNGHLYKTLGFEQSGEMQSCYWYVHNQTHQRFHRSSFMKKDLVRRGYDQALTEEQIMMQTDYLRIYDSGQTKYILRRN